MSFCGKLLGLAPCIMAAKRLDRKINGTVAIWGAKPKADKPVLWTSALVGNYNIAQSEI